jgi:hypothetical protein
VVGELGSGLSSGGAADWLAIVGGQLPEWPYQLRPATANAFAVAER